MPKVNISKSTFKRLQKASEPLVDTIDDVILKALDALDSSRARKAGTSENGMAEASARPETIFDSGPLGKKRGRRKPRVRSTCNEVSERTIDPDNPGGVTHTKIREACLDGRTVVRPRWNRLLDELILRALREGGDFDEVRRLARSKMVRGRKLDQGFVHYPDLDVSMQRRDADTACRGIAALARHLGAEIDIGFEWREKEGSRHPGDRGRLRVGASPARRG